MATPAYDTEFVDELAADVEAYLHRCSLLTNFAESQVEERVRLTRLVNQLTSDREALVARITYLERHPIVRLLRAPRRFVRAIRNGHQP